MAVKIGQMKGMTDAIEAVLKAEGLTDNEKFLEVACTPKGRKDLAAKCNVETRVILELANRADLSRLDGVAGGFSDLLEAAGVDTVKELATRRPDNLHAKIIATNAEKKVSGRNPTAADVEAWVAQAKELPKTLQY